MKTAALLHKKDRISKSSSAPIPNSTGINEHSSVQLKDNRPQAVVQNKQLAALMNHKTKNTIQKKENNTGLPDDLRSAIENLSGFDMGDTKVHYNSDKPAQLNAHAFAQGTDIHLATGQEQHLPHEAWHIVQQKQGRVKPTLQMKSGVNINDDDELEKEADAFGKKASNLSNVGLQNSVPNISNDAPFNSIVQRNGVKTAVDAELKSWLYYQKVISEYLNNEGQVTLKPEEITELQRIIAVDNNYIIVDLTSDYAKSVHNTISDVTVGKNLVKDGKNFLFVKWSLFQDDPVRICKAIIHEAVHTDYDDDTNIRKKVLDENIMESKLYKLQAEFRAYWRAEDFGGDDFEPKLGYKGGHAKLLARIRNKVTPAQFDKAEEIINHILRDYKDVHDYAIPTFSSRELQRKFAVWVEDFVNE